MLDTCRPFDPAAEGRRLGGVGVEGGSGGDAGVGPGGQGGQCRDREQDGECGDDQPRSRGSDLGAEDPVEAEAGRYADRDRRDGGQELGGAERRDDLPGGGAEAAGDGEGVPGLYGGAPAEEHGVERGQGHQRERDGEHPAGLVGPHFDGAEPLDGGGGVEFGVRGTAVRPDGGVEREERAADRGHAGHLRQAGGEAGGVRVRRRGHDVGTGGGRAGRGISLGHGVAGRQSQGQGGGGDRDRQQEQEGLAGRRRMSCRISRHVSRRCPTVSPPSSAARRARCRRSGAPRRRPGGCRRPASRRAGRPPGPRWRRPARHG